MVPAMCMNSFHWKDIGIKKQYPDAEVITHPECKQPVVQVSDFVGSTAALLKHTVKSDKKQFIVATESGVIHEMRKQSPGKEFIPAPPADSTCACNECNFMSPEHDGETLQLFKIRTS